MQVLRSDIDPAPMLPNIAQLLERNVKQFGDRVAYAELLNGVFEGITWKAMYENILNIAWNLQHRYGFRKGDKMVIYSPNRREMLELSLAVMATGGVSVPIFAYFHTQTAMLLINHSDARFIAVAGQIQLSRLNDDADLQGIFIFDEEAHGTLKNCYFFNELLKPRGDASYRLDVDAASDEVCLNMYTSGTMGIPKGVQLMHRNILSQQAALTKLWKLDSNDRFLSYLPWHHSFGGIFELFSALYNGATYHLESSYGKDPKVIFENWKKVRPTVFFSVPKVYQAMLDEATKDSESNEIFFHSGLKFVFTAAAPLPKKLSDEFEKNNIPVIEGWGLTETSPCCTLTDPSLKRETGVIGKPIPGVEIRLAEDGEIQVKGPNVMKCYYNNEPANRGIFTDDGWFCTGDIGSITPSGVKLITRKDRIFKLTNGEKVIPSELEQLIQTKCHYVSYAVIVGGGEEFPVALIFPDKRKLDHPDYELSPEEGCFCPRNLSELNKCLTGCLHDVNCGLNQKFSKVKYAMIIDDELSIEKSTLTPSMKISPTRVMDAYKAHIRNLYGDSKPIDEEVYVIRLDTENTIARKLQS